VHVWATHVPLSQTSEAQSEFAPQPPRFEQGRHVPPPQSTPVSAPFLTWSSHVAATQTFAVHTRDWQSAPAWHAAPSAQPAHVPPQSRAVSYPFWTPSSHAGAAHDPAVQTLDAQSLATEQPRSAAHGAHAPPPQSRSVSAPFCTPSVHDGATHVPLHTSDAQSSGASHTSPTPHPGHEPPQSRSVSSPSWVPLPQVVG
jgi:hypothetical protein